MVPINLTDKIQAFINNVLREDVQTFTAVGELAGKLIKIEISGPDILMFLQFDTQGITIKADHDAKPNVTIKARPSSYIGLLLDRNDNVTQFSPDMEIIGDAGLAQRFQQILNNIEIDWEEHLSHWVGDTVAHKLGRIFRQTRKYFGDTRHTMELDISEYLRYEKDMLPDRDEVEEFIASVDVLRNDAERLIQRIERLQGKITDKVRHHG